MAHQSTADSTSEMGMTGTVRRAPGAGWEPAGSRITVKDVPVSGEGKTSWDDLKRGDWVIVTWELFDKPRIAYEVEVVPEKKEAGEDL